MSLFRELSVYGTVKFNHVFCKELSTAHIQLYIATENSTIIGELNAVIAKGVFQYTTIKSIKRLKVGHAVLIANSTIDSIESEGVFVDHDSTLVIQNTTIKNISKYGLRVSGTLFLKNVIIENIDEYGISLLEEPHRKLHMQNVIFRNAKPHSITDLAIEEEFINVSLNGKPFTHVDTSHGATLQSKNSVEESTQQDLTLADLDLDRYVNHQNYLAKQLMSTLPPLDLHLNTSKLIVSENKSIKTTSLDEMNATKSGNDSAFELPEKSSFTAADKGGLSSAGGTAIALVVLLLAVGLVAYFSRHHIRSV